MPSLHVCEAARAPVLNLVLNLSDITIGNWVKVNLHGERFWCQIIEKRCDGVMVGVVDNEVQYISALRCGDKIELLKNHVLEVAGQSDMQNFINLSMVMGVVDAALLWRAHRVASGTTAPILPGTRLLVPTATARSNAPRACST